MSFKPEIKSYHGLMDELRREQQKNKAQDGIGKAVLISVLLLIGVSASIASLFVIFGL